MVKGLARSTLSRYITFILVSIHLLCIVIKQDSSCSLGKQHVFCSIATGKVHNTVGLDFYLMLT